jgi:hypothetical protein
MSKYLFLRKFKTFIMKFQNFLLNPSETAANFEIHFPILFQLAVKGFWQPTSLPLLIFATSNRLTWPLGPTEAHEVPLLPPDHCHACASDHLSTHDTPNAARANSSPPLQNLLGRTILS